MATVAELRATAKAKGLKGYSKLNKQQLKASSSSTTLKHKKKHINSKNSRSSQKLK